MSEDIQEKVIKYFCDFLNCSDGDDNKYPECKIKGCLYRDEAAHDLIDIIDSQPATTRGEIR